MAFEPLPAPGVAVFPQFLSQAPVTVTMKGKAFGDDWSVTYGDSDQAFLTIDADKMSMSHRKHLIDPSSGQEICEIRKESFSGHSRYTGANPTDSSALFDTETHFHFSGNETTLKFINNAAGSQQDTLEFKNQPFSSYGEVTYKGKPVASISKKKMSMKGQYDLQVAPGFDPFLIVALTVVLDDKEKSNQRGARAGAAAGGGGGA